MKYDVQGGQKIGNSSQGRSLKMCQYEVVPNGNLKQWQQRRERQPQQVWQPPQLWPLPRQDPPVDLSPPASQSWEDVHQLWQE